MTLTSLRSSAGWVALVAVATIMAAAAAPSAFGAPMGVSGYFPASGSGQDGGGGQLAGPVGVAVNWSGAGAADPGDVYVVDGSYTRVQVFSGSGVFKFAFGRDVVRPGALENVVVNDLQRVTVAGAAGGVFALGDVNGSGGLTPLIAFDAPAGDPGTPGVVDSVQEALEATSNVDVGDVSVSGPAGGPWEVEFTGALGDRDIQQMTVASSALVPGGASVSVATLVEGANVAERCSVAADCKGGEGGRLGGMFRGPRGIAIDQSDGSVYVSEQQNVRVQKFSADGTFERAWGRDVSIGGVSTGAEVCVVASDCKSGSSGGASARGGEFSNTFSGFVAVAPTGAPNAGNVVVADPGNRRVQEFGPAGGFVRAWGHDVLATGAVTGFEVCAVAGDCKPGTAGAGVGQFATGQPTKVAVDSTGAVYAVESSGNFRVQKFDQALTGPAVFAGGVLSGTAVASAPSDVAVGAGDRVFVAKQFANGAGVPPVQAPGERRVLELDPTGTLLDTHAALAGLGSATLSGVDGIAADPSTGTVYVSSASFFAPGATTPTVTGVGRIYALDPVLAPSGGFGVSAVSEHSALFSGAVDPNGPGTAIGVRTSYRLETSEDGVTWSTLAATDAGKGFDAVGFNKTATGLAANTTYLSRLVIVKEFNPQVVVPGPTFTTPASRPDLEALAPTDRTTDSATLKARVNPNGAATSYRFDYGPTAAYGSSVPTPDGDAGSATAPAVVSEPIVGLQPDTVYHFRVTATNANGTAVTTDRTFKTRGIQPPPERGLEMVSQPDKIGGVGVGLWPGGVAHLASAGVGAYDDDRFLVGGSYGSPLNGDSKQGFTNDWSAADRTPAGWRSHPVISHPNYQPRIAQFVGLKAVSEDLSRAFMDGENVTPAIFPEMGADNRWTSFNTGYFLDWGSSDSPSRWELLGPARLDQIGDVGGDSNVWNMAFSADGSRLVAQTKLDPSSPPRSAIFGLAGPGDPTWPAFGDLIAGRSVYLADTSGAPADSYAGTGLRTLVNTCTDAGGRTGLPGVSGGVLTETACPGALAGRDSRLVSARGAALATPSIIVQLDGTVSADGSRVFFMSPDPSAAGVPTAGCAGSGDGLVCPPQLFVREERGGIVRTRWISKAEPALFGAQAASLTGSVRFEGSTPDGDKVFFRTNSPLTVDDPNGAGSAPPAGGVKTGSPSGSSWDLYMYDLPDDPDADLDTGLLTRISAGPQGSDCNSPLPSDNAEGANSGAAALRFASDDGSRVYFVCSAPLDGVAGVAGGSITDPAGTPTTADHTNLYLYDTHQPQTQRWTFVARIPRAVLGSGNPFDDCASTGSVRRSPLVASSGATFANLYGEPPRGSGMNCFGGTADGGFVTFFTTGRLTADDPASPLTGDVYAYDAAATELVRITAAHPDAAGGSYLCAPGKPGSPLPTDTVLCHGDGGADQQSAVSTIQGGVVNAALGVVTDPEVPGDRVAFFQSAARLVPEDLDSGYDVYQWRNGVLSLVTSGAADSKHALYRGNSRDGRNVYFATQDALTWQDYDAVNDVYVARVGGGIPEPDPPPPCDVLAGACQGAGVGPVDVGPVSSAPTSDGDATVDRTVLSVAAVGAKARRQAAQSGVLVLRVRSSKAGRVVAVATGRIANRTRRLGRAAKTLAGPGSTTLRLRLNRPARTRLRAGKRLGVSVRVTAPDARARSLAVVLRRAGR